MLVYQLGWMDEQGTPVSGPSGARLHPLLSLLTCESLLGEFSPALPAAAAVELVHNYSRIHGDVQSGNPDRDQRPTVWWIWGPGQAINAGDGMHALARLTLMRLKGRGTSVTRVLQAMRLLDQSCLSMCEGQHLDLEYQEKLSVGTSPYLDMAAGRTGALMGCAMGLGALVAGGDDGTVSAFRECGKNLGIAFQIQGDIHDLWGSAGESKPPGNVLNKSKLLPIVYALETADISTKRELGTIYFKRVLEPHDLEHIVRILDGQSAREYALGKAGDHLKLAHSCLEAVDLSPWGREQMEVLFRYIAEGEE